MKHVYNDAFFDYINQSAQSSAQALIARLFPLLQPKSVVDLGSGRGVWLAQWQRSGAQEVLGVDGEYVDQSNLAIQADAFKAANLTQPLAFEKRYDLAQSLEVGEHLPLSAAETLVDSLVAASDTVLFSAAVKGQGGEFHINEQPLSFWQDLFEARGYQPFDCLRPHMKNDSAIAPWYRYNAVLYVNAEGRKTLPEAVTKYAIPTGQRVKDGGGLPWRLRKLIVANLPRPVVTMIAQVRAKIIATSLQLRKAKIGQSA